MTMKTTGAAIAVGLLLGVALAAYVTTNYSGRTAVVILMIVALCLTGVSVAAGLLLRDTFRD